MHSLDQKISHFNFMHALQRAPSKPKKKETIMQPATLKPYIIIPRWEKAPNGLPRAILFMPSEYLRTKSLHLDAYCEAEGHGSASYPYYLATKPAKEGDEAWQLAEKYAKTMGGAVRIMKKIVRKY